ncbi:MAG: 2,3-bisphosphoglycerate-independent phosphoglycerate mutase [Bacteroidales bacterium]|nr:2,3-bisphosphoglycerate-independent phosphoglycerate mutase [Bacteroidales bacterium]MCF8332711.1 2,3-bisphosphoglycerate-independent phosphoglycerate mutase [Bacteroidales bacterium]
MNKNKKALLIILDGWGNGNKDNTDAVHEAHTPYMDSLLKNYPNSELRTDGSNVGLPDGQMGNSEVGHLNIGAGRIVYQDLVRINKAIEDNSIAENETLKEAFTYAKNNNKAVHFIGLVSDGGVHSMHTHLYKLTDLTGDYGLDKVYVHALTDGRDTDPRSGYGYMKNLLNHLEKSNGTVASITGRYYGMDRDKRWERIKVAYDAMVHGKGEQQTSNLLEAVQHSYDSGITDEFIKPVINTDKNGYPVGTINEGDVVMCFNFRTDRLRELTTVLTQKDMPEHDMHTMPLHYLTMTEYDKTFKGIKVVFDKQQISNVMGEIIANEGRNQIRIAETEKYAHVTFFFNGGREEEFDHEKRIMIPSPKVATYDLQPEMSAYEVKDAIVEEIKKQEVDLVVLNFANGDMVGHTGVFESIVKALESVDECLKEVVESGKANGYESLIIADHGNADNAVNADGSANTAHSMNPVPCVLVSDYYQKINNGILADVSPTLLDIMEIDKPSEMTGESLIEK